MDIITERVIVLLDVDRPLSIARIATALDIAETEAREALESLRAERRAIDVGGIGPSTTWVKVRS